MSTMTSPTSAPGSRRDGLLNALVGIAAIIVVGLPIQAFLASYGLFEGESGFISVHRVFGMVLVLLIAIQVVMYALLVQRGVAGRGAFVGSIVVLLVYLAQMMLGFATRDDAGMAAWHIPLGVLLMGGSVMGLLRAQGMRNGNGAA
ncbi:MAG TPA: hypothetical protein VM450_11990 [Thermomicrobiales bacterium]|nr:hypothetical protein [Thermomicrobiales bacterium]